MVALGFVLTITACAGVEGDESARGQNDDLLEADGASAQASAAGDGVALSEHALINPNLTGPGLIVNPVDPGIITVGSRGGVVTGPDAKKTPCEKASNQFYRAQAAYLAAADALKACGYSFLPQCAAQTATFNTASDALTAAYAKFLQECE
jgi:hypothetical protein